MVRGISRVLLVLLAAGALSGCGTMYLVQAARGQLNVMNERRPIQQVVADPDTPEALRAKLLEVGAARDFASEKLGLPQNGSYRTYADLGRSYVVWNVVATPEFSVEPKRWCFPVAGCVAYRGYFSEAAAKKFAAKLRAEGFDVVVGGVPAYSTLGRFADPVLNTMLGYGDVDLAAIIFHELSHQVVYVPGDSAFNEAFAVAVEQEALQRWLAFRGREAELERYKARADRQLDYVGLFRRRRGDLAELYASRLPPDEMRQRKTEIFAALERDIQELEKRHGARSGYGEWVKDGLNNAHLASVATYFDCVPGFARLLEEQDKDLTRFYAAVRELANLPGTERRARIGCRKRSMEPAPSTGVTQSSESP
jgi:predicted aminopeptidase